MERLFGLLILLLVAGTIKSQKNEIDLDDIKKNFDNIGFDDNNQTGPALENAMPAIEEAQKVIREKCERNGGEGAYDNLEVQKLSLQQCIQNNINFTVAQDEVEEAKKTGSMDEVFAKYCKKIPDIMTCVNNVTDALEACLEKKEKNSLVVVRNVTESLLNFTCFKDGDRIAMFVAEGGIKCVEEQKPGLEECLNSTVAGKIPEDLNVNNLPLLIFETQECQSFDTFHHCAVDTLEKCENNTPANIIDALFKFIRKITPCNNFKKSANPLVATQKSSSTTLNVSVVSFVMLVVVKYF